MWAFWPAGLGIDDYEGHDCHVGRLAGVIDNDSHLQQGRQQAGHHHVTANLKTVVSVRTWKDMKTWKTMRLVNEYSWLSMRLTHHDSYGIMVITGWIYQPGGH